MKVFKGTTRAIPFDGTALTVGTFDGVHKGHRIIIDKLNERARALGLHSLLFTFEPHPKIVMQKAGAPEIHLLTTIDEKIAVLQSIGLDFLVIAKFTASFAATSAEDFVRNTLVRQLKMKCIIIGHDHGFGRDRQGNDELLKRLGRELDFQVCTVPPISNGGEHISSTRIRQAVQDGHVEAAASMLGRPYEVTGTVAAGKKLGRKLGFPTANLQPHAAKLVPRAGIYATRVRIGDQWHQSVTYIGARPTFGGAHNVVEVHVCDFDENLYGKSITVCFFRRLRDDRQFLTSDELIKAITKDKKDSLTYFANGG
ncbi:bifunctional riboflavin kinase/FAD synthetase [candidate division KSB1 bacterium]|nr:bifunctional riboflavin kinase/FAD synthetase [candidate division KSB1 bacterium]